MLLYKTWQRLRLLGIVGAAGAIVIIRWSAASLIGQNEPHTGNQAQPFRIGEHC